MYCTNVRNYVIKIHVFDYLISAATLCLDYPANFDRKQLTFMNVISSGKQLLRYYSTLLSYIITCKLLEVNLDGVLVQLQLTRTVIRHQVSAHFCK